MFGDERADAKASFLIKWGKEIYWYFESVSQNTYTASFEAQEDCTFVVSTTKVYLGKNVVKKRQHFCQSVNFLEQWA